jgi:hypothetical protein
VVALTLRIPCSCWLVTSRGAPRRGLRRQPWVAGPRVCEKCMHRLVAPIQSSIIAPPSGQPRVLLLLLGGWGKAPASPDPCPPLRTCVHLHCIIMSSALRARDSFHCHPFPVVALWFPPLLARNTSTTPRRASLNACAVTRFEFTHPLHSNERPRDRALWGICMLKLSTLDNGCFFSGS